MHIQNLHTCIQSLYTYVLKTKKTEKDTERKKSALKKLTIQKEEKKKKRKKITLKGKKTEEKKKKRKKITLKGKKTRAARKPSKKTKKTHAPCAPLSARDTCPDAREKGCTIDRVLAISTRISSPLVSPTGGYC